MCRQIITLIFGSALVACSSSTERPPTDASTIEACMASASTAESELDPPDVPTVAILRPGDVACFGFDAAHNVQAVPQATASTPHITARMTVEPGMTMLAIKNVMSSQLAYRAFIRLPGAAEWQETSIAPVMAGLSGFESWPHPIDAIALLDMRLETGH
jgi:hypothetical protein